MAVSSWGVNDPIAKKTWATKLFVDVTANTFWGKFVGKGSNSLIQWKDETSKDKGDRVTVGLRTLLTGNGIQGDDTLEGNEEQLSTYTMNLVIDQLRHAVRSGGKMSAQRVPFDVRDECRGSLEDWWTERLDTSMANQLTGNTSQADTRYTGNQVATIPSSANSITRIIVGGDHQSEASLSATTTHIIGFRELDKCVALAKTQSQRIRPVRVDGSDYFVAFLHPYQIYQMRRNDTGNAGFYDVYKAAMQGGKISDNPIIQGANFIYNNVIVHEWAYLPNVISTVTSYTSYRRGVFCGAQAAVFATGQGGSPTKMSWTEEYFDYENQLGVAGGMIFGIKKSVFNSVDYGTICLSGYAPAPV